VDEQSETMDSLVLVQPIMAVLEIAQKIVLLIPMKNNLIIGRNAVIELLDSDKQVEKIWLQVGTRGEFEKELRHKLKGRNIPVQHVPAQKLNKLSSGNHQGVAAFTSIVEYQSITDVVSLLYEEGKMPFIVVLDGVTDVRNLGAIARSAEIFGAHAIVSPVKDSAIVNEIAYKTSGGALSHIAVCREKSMVRTIESLQEMGLTIFAAEHHSEHNIRDIDFRGPVAVVFGDEGKGVSEKIIRNSNTFKINQVGKTESLNVSVAAGVVMYEISQSRLLK